jgi:mono/diheme cytochrome c family protein
MKIQKKIDVKKLKHQLWTFINPKIEHTNGMKEIIIHGKGVMPAAQVNEAQATAISEYVISQLKGH